MGFRNERADDTHKDLREVEEPRGCERDLTLYEYMVEKRKGMSRKLWMFSTASILFKG